MSQAAAEFQSKINLLRALLDQHSVDALLLRRVSSFAWATCGAASYVNTAITEGAASLLVTSQHLYLATNVIEAPRLEQEEGLVQQGWEFHISPWDAPLQALHHLVSGLSLASDVPFPGALDISAEIARMRTRLTPEEGERFRALGGLCAEALTAAAQRIYPGLSEFQIAALVGSETQQRGVQPIVNLVATDERAYRFRHPLPTEKKLDKYAMLILSGRRQGLVCSISRLVHIGPPPDDLRQRINATAQVNAACIAHSRPGCSLSEVLSWGQKTYTSVGFPDEWRWHLQGGLTGYEPREVLATPASKDVITLGQVLAWNPTIAGAKVEDTILVGLHSNEILTRTSLWPVAAIQVPGLPGEVPCSLVLEVV
ncbi:MAG TPA: M24 family metallopeptidase [Anaerolineales bacterium]|nr:M24 family metallopeptidase [Anaerolineales bacterium]